MDTFKEKLKKTLPKLKQKFETAPSSQTSASTQQTKEPKLVAKDESEDNY